MYIIWHVTDTQSGSQAGCNRSDMSMAHVWCDWGLPVQKC